MAESRVLSAAEVATLGQSLQPTDAEQFAKALVKQQTLTKFQAQQLFNGKGKTLVLGNYMILEKLGQGGMELVLNARHRGMQRTVALKVLSPADSTELKITGQCLASYTGIAIESGASGVENGYHVLSHETAASGWSQLGFRVVDEVTSPIEPSNGRTRGLVHYCQP